MISVDAILFDFAKGNIVTIFFALGALKIAAKMTKKCAWDDQISTLLYDVFAMARGKPLSAPPANYLPAPSYPVGVPPPKERGEEITD